MRCSADESTPRTGKGALSPAEANTRRDERTGVVVRQVTAHPSIHHHLYFYVSSYPDDGSRLFFVSHRTGRPNLFCELTGERRLLQLTDREELNEWSPQPSRDGRSVYFIAGGAAWRLELATLREERVATFGHEAGATSLGSASCSLSADGAYLAVCTRSPAGAALEIIDTRTGRSQRILERDTIMHVLFCPDDSSWLEYAGPLDRRLWAIRRDGTGHRALYEAAPGQWITHESWLPGRKEVIFTDWPRALRAVHVESGAVRTIAAFNAWHASAGRDGRQIVADTNAPDIGLQWIDAATGARRTLCYPEASNQGDHWHGPFPYATKPYPKIHAPQHTHPHPSFRPDGTRVVFTSDRSGYSQVYEAILDPK